MSLNSFPACNALSPNTHTLVPEAKSSTSPAAKTQPRRVSITPLSHSTLPGAMRNMGWQTGASLIQRWFDSEAWQMPETWKDKAPAPGSIPAKHLDTSLVRMDWG